MVPGELRLRCCLSKHRPLQDAFEQFQTVCVPPDEHVAQVVGLYPQPSFDRTRLRSCGSHVQEVGVICHVKR